MEKEISPQTLFHSLLLLLTSTSKVSPHPQTNTYHLPQESRLDSDSPDLRCRDKPQGLRTALPASPASFNVCSTDSSTKMTDDGRAAADTSDANGPTPPAAIATHSHELNFVQPSTFLQRPDRPSSSRTIPEKPPMNPLDMEQMQGLVSLTRDILQTPLSATRSSRPSAARCSRDLHHLPSMALAAAGARPCMVRGFIHKTLVLDLAALAHDCAAENSRG